MGRPTDIKVLGTSPAPFRTGTNRSCTLRRKIALPMPHTSIIRGPKHPGTPQPAAKQPYFAYCEARDDGQKKDENTVTHSWTSLVSVLRQTCVPAVWF